VDVTSSASWAQACANALLHLKPEVKGRTKEYVKMLLATEANEFQAKISKLVDTLRK
jgi:hypothetical protein